MDFLYNEQNKKKFFFMKKKNVLKMRKKKFNENLNGLRHFIKFLLQFKQHKKKRQIFFRMI